MTEKSRALWDVLGAMASYGYEWLFEEPSEIEFYDKRTGERVRPAGVDSTTGKPLHPASTRRRRRQ